MWSNVVMSQPVDGAQPSPRMPPLPTVIPPETVNFASVIALNPEPGVTITEPWTTTVPELGSEQKPETVTDWYVPGASTPEHVVPDPAPAVPVPASSSAHAARTA